MPIAAASSPARARRKDALSELRRTEILAAATRVFGRKGFDATRAEDIAAAARIAKGTLYLYFKSKEAIYTAAVQLALSELRAEIARHAASATGFREKLATTVRVRLEFWPEHDAIYRLLMTVGREPKHRRQTNEVLCAAMREFRSIFQEGVEAGELAPGDFEQLAWATLDLIRGANERRMDKLSSTTPQEDAVRLTAFVLTQIQKPQQ